MQKKQTLILLAALGVLSLAVFAPESALAQTNQTVARNLLQDIVGLLQGRLGVLVGLVITVIGFYSYVFKQATWGIAMMIGGAAATIVPRVYVALQGNVRDSLSKSLGDSTTGTTGNASTNQII